MTAKTAKWYEDASREELQERAGEMRGEWSTLTTMDRESDDFRSAKREFTDEVETLDVQLGLRAKMDLDVERRNAPAGVHTGTGREYRSLGDQVVNNEQFAEWCQRAVRQGDIGRSPMVDVRDASMELRTLVSETSSSSELLPVGQPFLGNVRQRKLFIRDLINVQHTGLSAVPYVRELNATTNQTGASTVLEGNTKPEITIEFEPATAIVEVIAATIPITRQILEDGPTLRSYIDTRLQYVADFREEDEILRGNGISPDLPGILNQSGVQTQASAGSGEHAITLGNAIAKIEVVDLTADGIAMSPSSFWAMMTHRAASGAGTFDAAAFTNSPINYVWGLPVVRTNSLSTNQNLVGSFQMASSLFDRSEQGVRVYEQHSDFAVKNKVLLLLERRRALAHYRTDGYVIATTS